MLILQAKLASKTKRNCANRTGQTPTPTRNENRIESKPPCQCICRLGNPPPFDSTSGFLLGTNSNTQSQQRAAQAILEAGSAAYLTVDSLRTTMHLGHPYWWLIRHNHAHAHDIQLIVHPGYLQARPGQPSLLPHCEGTATTRTSTCLLSPTAP